ncbi:P-loop containing nucleoside triphosphate hydrolase protein [Poronia punctata]|nr:P-loop containing nucleoside triphosphate hydrolase protein [Poronia punctata]
MVQPFHADGATTRRGPLLGLAGADSSSMRRLFQKGYHAVGSSGASQALTLWSVWGLGTTIIPNLVDIFSILRHYVRVFFTSSVTIRATDELYLQVFSWLATRESQRRFVKEFTAQTLSDARAPPKHPSFPGRPSWRARPPQPSAPETKGTSKIKYVPAFKTTWFFYGKNLFGVLRNDKHSSKAMFPPSGITPVYDYYGPVPSGDYKESVTITCLGWSTAPIQAMLETCRKMAEENRRTSVTIRSCRDAQWELSAVKPVRSLDTIHLGHAVKDDLISDLEEYLDPERRRFYSEQGIPYRRGYLLYGPPGCGKSSLSLALAGKFGLDLYMVNIATLFDGDLEHLFSTLPARCLVLLEDIDAAGLKRGEDEETSGQVPHPRRPRSANKCSLSSLLNVLDGVDSQEGRIVIMTTNHPEQLDDALVRPGRIDVKIRMGYISAQGAEQMFMRMMNTGRFDRTRRQVSGGVDAMAGRPQLNTAQKDVGVQLGEVDDDLQMLASQFADEVPAETFSPAQIQGYLLRYLHSPGTARDEISGWVAEEKRKAEDKAREEAITKQQKRKVTEKKNYPEGAASRPEWTMPRPLASRNGRPDIIVQFPSHEALMNASTKVAAAETEATAALDSTNGGDP